MRIVRAGSGEAGSAALRFLISMAALLPMVLVVWWARPAATPEPLGAERARQRHAILEEVRQSESALAGYARIHEEAGIWRIPIGEAMQRVAEEWEDPLAARREMVRRAGTMAPPPPPPAPEPAPSPFE